MNEAELAQAEALRQTLDAEVVRAIKTLMMAHKAAYQARMDRADPAADAYQRLSDWLRNRPQS